MKITESKETQEKRLKICRKCPELRQQFLGIFKAESCNICKCNLKAKTKMMADFGGKCPEGKW